MRLGAWKDPESLVIVTKLAGSHLYAPDQGRLFSLTPASWGLQAESSSGPSLPLSAAPGPPPPDPAIRNCVGSNRWELRQPEEQSTKHS